MSKMLKVAIPFLIITFLNACGGGGGTTKNKDTEEPPTQSTSHNVKNKSDASDFLNRTTFDPTKESINHLVGKKPMKIG